MRRKVITITTLLSMLIMFSACANLNFKLNPNKTPYDQAISFFTDAWNSYHKVWLALPEEKKVASGPDESKKSSVTNFSIVRRPPLPSRSGMLSNALRSSSIIALKVSLTPLPYNVGE